MSSPSPYIVSSMNIVIQVVGITSSVATATILLTLMLFPSMMFREKLDSSRSMTSGITNSGNSNSAAYPRSDTASSQSSDSKTGKKYETNNYVHMVLMLSISEFIAAVCFGLGFVTDPEICTMQGALLNFFQRSKWFWNAMISLQLYMFMVHDQPGLSLTVMHAIVWTLCISLEMLPYTTGTEYGADDGNLGLIVCYMHEPNPDTVDYWVAVTYGAPLVVCTVIMAYFAYRLYERFNYLSELEDDTSKQIMNLVKTMIMYPTAMFLTTAPNLVIFATIELDPALFDYQTSILGFVWSFTYGIWLSVIFFVNSQEAKRRWRSLVCGVEYIETNNRLVRGNKQDMEKVRNISNINRSLDMAMGNAMSTTVSKSNNNNLSSKTSKTSASTGSISSSAGSKVGGDDGGVFIETSNVLHSKRQDEKTVKPHNPPL